MIKRIRIFITALIMLVTIVASPMVTQPASAATMAGSEQVVAFIKEYEGFRSYVYWDGGYAYIGYGKRCSSTDYPDGITREKAEVLLREEMAVKEKSLNTITSKYDVVLTQSQFDALLSFSYNLGIKWMDSSNRIFRYMTTGFENYTDIEIVNAIATWCHQGPAILPALVERRLREAKMFLYGDYDGSDPHAYRYLTYDAEDGSVEHSIMFYDYGQPYGALQEAARSGYTLAGWLTKSGKRINTYTTASENLAITASWTQGTVPIQTTGYTDVNEDDWFYKYVSELSEQGILSGYPDGTFMPDNTVKGGETLKLVMLAVGFAEQSPTNGHWASGYLSLAASIGIVGDDVITNLDTPISRRDVAEIAAKAIGLPPLEPEDTFKDTQDGYVLALYYCGILTGNTDTGVLMFYPDDNIERDELSAVIWRIANSGVLKD